MGIFFYNSVVFNLQFVSASFRKFVFKHLSQLGLSPAFYMNHIEMESFSSVFFFFVDLFVSKRHSDVQTVRGVTVANKKKRGAGFRATRKI